MFAQPLSYICIGKKLAFVRCQGTQHLLVLELDKYCTVWWLLRWINTGLTQRFELVKMSRKRRNFHSLKGLTLCMALQLLVQTIFSNNFRNVIVIVIWFYLYVTRYTLKPYKTWIFTLFYHQFYICASMLVIQHH